MKPRTKIAVILGTGCNAAYTEDVGCIGKIKDKGVNPQDQVAINCEWVSTRCQFLLFRLRFLKGAFDSHLHEHLPRTEYDRIIDETSNKPGEQAFEKMISGKYLGEVLRLVICEMINEGTLFLGQTTDKIEKPYSFDTAFLSLMES